MTAVASRPAPAAGRPADPVGTADRLRRRLAAELAALVAVGPAQRAAQPSPTPRHTPIRLSGRPQCPAEDAA